MTEFWENEEKELMKLLQIDSKGWKIDLFENENDVLHALCAECNSVCRDAVELGCEHSDAQIFLHCNNCLNKLIINNNGNCPINNHSNPIIFKNRATRNLISKSIVLCPYSIKYNCKTNAIMATNTSNTFEEKEGMNSEIINGCNFKGTIDNLLKNHILKCIKIHNPLFMQNIIKNKYKNKIKKLKNKNNKLQNQLNKQSENQKLNEKISKQNEMLLKNQVNHLTNKNQNINQKCFLLHAELNKQHQIQKTNENKTKQRIVLLENEIEKLKQELRISNDKIMFLEMVSNQSFQTPNNICNEETKNDETNTPDGMTTLWGISGSKMKINGNRVTYNSGGWNTIYINTPFATGKHTIKVKVLEKSINCDIIIGITSTTQYKNGLSFGTNKDSNYGYYSEGWKYSHDGGVSGVSAYSSNDTILIHVDLLIGKICFYKNNKNIYEKNIKKHKYYMAISMGCNWGCNWGGNGLIEIV